MLLLILAIFLLLPDHCLCLCSDPAVCIVRLRKIVAESRRYWFGEQWKDACTGRRYTDRINCYNPETLRTFHSMGSRLFRVKTYQNEYLKNLRIFPTISYRPTKGIQRYRACDHDFVFNGTEAVIDVNPDMEPVKPYDIRYAPDIQWTGIYNRSYVILAVDVGFGTLNYMAVRSPSGDRIIREYAGAENFRHQPNPVVFLILETFGQFGLDSLLHFDSENFDLPTFMIDYGLEAGLIGMNIMLVSTDPYAIEKQRLRGIVDNCHSLIIQRVKLEKQWPIADILPLAEINNWVSVSFDQPDSTVELCCHKFILKKQTLITDPLGDEMLSSVAVRNEPRVTMMKNAQMERDGFQRNIRNHFNSADIDRYNTLILFDPGNSFLYWLIVDIPSASLSAGDVHDGNTIVPYLAPIPLISSVCNTAVLMILAQPPSFLPSVVSKYYKYNAIYANCQQNCSQRSHFDIVQFKSLHQLQLSAINWFNTCYDAFEVIIPQSQHSSNGTTADSISRKQMVPLSDIVESDENVKSQRNVQTTERYRRNNTMKSKKTPMDFCISVGLSNQEPCYQQLISVGAKISHSSWIFTYAAICIFFSSEFSA